MEADISGLQRKVLSSSCGPLKRWQGEEGIPVRDGKTLPFEVARAWSAPEGYYDETWYLIDPTSREVLIEGPVRNQLIWGLQALTELTDEVKERHSLTPGTYRIMFALGGALAGELDVTAVEVPAEEAA